MKLLMAVLTALALSGCSTALEVHDHFNKDDEVDWVQVDALVAAFENNFSEMGKLEFCDVWDNEPERTYKYFVSGLEHPEISKPSRATFREAGIRFCGPTVLDWGS